MSRSRKLCYVQNPCGVVAQQNLACTVSITLVDISEFKDRRIFNTRHNENIGEIPLNLII